MASPQQQAQAPAPAQPAQPPAQQPRQQVTVNAALDTLCTMFESVDRDVVHMILVEGCGGNMEGAVEALLTMTGGISVSAPKKDKKEEANPQKSAMNLADDFLRPPSYFLSKYESVHEIDKERSEQRQVIEDEMFAKAIFEDSLFATDLQNHPEWCLEEIQTQKNQKSKKKHMFSWKNENDNIDLDNVDPSDINARRISFKQRFNTLGNTAKQKLGTLAHKLQRNKDESKRKSSRHEYTNNVLTSLDDETLIDEELDNGNNAIIEVASEDNRGTYQAPIVPSKPTQKL